MRLDKKASNNELAYVGGLVFILSVCLFVILVVELILWSTSEKDKHRLEPVGYSTFVFLCIIFMTVVVWRRDIPLLKSANNDRLFNIYKDWKSNLLIWVFFTIVCLLLVSNFWLEDKRIKGVRFSVVPFGILLFMVISLILSFRYVNKNEFNDPEEK